MKQRDLIIALIVGTLVLGYAAWYSFTYVAPALAWAIIIAYVIGVVYLPYNKITKNK